jgi:predicted ester cyclase
MSSSTNVVDNRFELDPAVRAILKSDTSEAKLLRHYLRYAATLLSKDVSEIDHVVTPDARFHDLEHAGYAQGPAGIKEFRRQVNAAFPDQRVLIHAVRFEGSDIIEVDLEAIATHQAELMGIAATGRKIRFLVHARDRFVDGRVAERWDQADPEDLRRQLTQPADQK